LQQALDIFKRLAKRTLSAFLGGLVLFIAVGSVCGPLHEKLHAASHGHSEHSCAFCLFLNGQVDSSDTAPVRSGFVFVECAVAAAVSPVLVSSSDIRLMPGRAPPILPLV
jgi:hypothetical protein